MLIKTTKSLFKGTYQYKIVLLCSAAHWFRSGDMDTTLEQLKKVDLSKSKDTHKYSTWYNPIKTQDELDYAFKLQKQLKKLTDIEVRVESPYISVYSNIKSDIDSLSKIDLDKVKYISVPSDTSSLIKDTVIMPKIPHDYRITMGKTTQNYVAFIGWAENNAKLKLTNSCKRDLGKDRSWGGTHFYVTGDNTLLMVKMHLGGSINKIERIVKA